MKNELLLIQPSVPDMGLQEKAVQLAQNGGLALRVLSIAQMEQQTDDDSCIAKALAEQAAQSRVVLAPATVRLRVIMPMLAWHLQAGLTADCTQLDISADGVLLQTRPAFGNSLMATISTVSPIQMATVRPGTFPNTKTQVLPVEELTADAKVEAVTKRSFRPFDAATPLSQAEVIVAGGLGVGSKEGFEKLAAFADAIGGTLAASRCAVDAGFAPYARQVGITGVTVCPKLYIAVGISGAVQHLSGMSGSETVIAINNDPKAPIFDYADYGMVGDWETIINAFMEELS